MTLLLNFIVRPEKSVGSGIWIFLAMYQFDENNQVFSQMNLQTAY